MDYNIRCRAEFAANALRIALDIQNEKNISCEKLISLFSKKITNLKIIQVEYPVHPISRKNINENRFEIIICKDEENQLKKEMLLHEVAHVMLHSELLPKFNGDTNMRCEEEANFFMRSFLLPSSIFIETVDKNSFGVDDIDIESVAKFFDVNENLVIRRGADLLGWE